MSTVTPTKINNDVTPKPYELRIFGKATKMAKNKAPNNDSRVKVFFKNDVVCFPGRMFGIVIAILFKSLAISFGFKIKFE